MGGRVTYFHNSLEPARFGVSTQRRSFPSLCLFVISFAGALASPPTQTPDFCFFDSPSSFSPPSPSRFESCFCRACICLAQTVHQTRTPCLPPCCLSADVSSLVPISSRSIKLPVHGRCSQSPETCPIWSIPVRS